MDIVCESHCGLLGWPGCYESLIGQGRNDREVCDGVLLSFMEALLSNCWSTAGRAPGGSGCHGPLVPWDGDGSPLRRYGVCFEVSEQGEGPQGSVRWMLPFRARLLAGQTRGDAHGENATPVQCIIIFIPSVHASGFITQTFEPFAHSEGRSDAQDDGAADTQAQNPRVQRGGVHPLPPVEVRHTREPNVGCDVHGQVGCEQLAHGRLQKLRVATKVRVPTTSSAPPQEIEECSSSSSSSSSSS